MRYQSGDKALAALRHRFAASFAVAVISAGAFGVVAVVATPSRAFAAASAVPAVTSVTPNFGSTSGGTEVTIAGTGLSGAKSVRFGGVPASVLSNSAKSITAVAPKQAAAGTVNVTVVTPAGTSQKTTKAAFKYVALAPASVEISPEYTYESCAGNRDVASWVPPSRVKGLTGYSVVMEQFTDEGPQFNTYDVGPDQGSMPFSVVNGETDFLLFTITAAGVSSQPFGGAEVTGFGVPQAMAWNDEGTNSVSDGSATVSFEWAGPPQDSETGGDVADDTVAITETPGGAVQDFAASTEGDSATFSSLTDGTFYTFSDTVSNVCGTSAAAQDSPVFIPGVLPTVSGTPPTGVVGDAYDFAFTSAGNPAPDLSVTSGALPPGLDLSDDGTISGTPTTPGSYSATVTAANDVGIQPFSSGQASDSFSMTVDEAPSLTSPDTAAFTVGQDGSFMVTSSGYPAPELSESGPLPSGLVFDVQPGGTASITGTPASGSNGVYPITVTASNGVAPDATQQLVITVAPAITSASFVTTIVASPFSFTVTTAGAGPVAITEAGKLPSGVNFTDNGDGTATISGTPAAGSGGSYVLHITATFGSGSSVQQVLQTFDLVVDQPLAITSSASATAVAGTTFSFKITTTGYPGATAITESGALPDGIKFSYGSGPDATLSGKAVAGTEGIYSLQIKATNAEGTSAAQTLTLVVKS
jgi:hypothetical protein